MTNLQYEVERDRIEISYREKTLKLENELRELAARVLDLKMQIADTERERYKVEAMCDELELMRDQELNKLQREYLAAKED